MYLIGSNTDPSGDLRDLFLMSLRPDGHAHGSLGVRNIQNRVDPGVSDDGTASAIARTIGVTPLLIGFNVNFQADLLTRFMEKRGVIFTPFVCEFDHLLECGREKYGSRLGHQRSDALLDSMGVLGPDRASALLPVMKFALQFDTPQLLPNFNDTPVSLWHAKRMSENERKFAMDSTLYGVGRVTDARAPGGVHIHHASNEDTNPPRVPGEAAPDLRAISQMLSSTRPDRSITDSPIPRHPFILRPTTGHFVEVTPMHEAELQRVRLGGAQHPVSGDPQASRHGGKQDPAPQGAPSQDPHQGPHTSQQSVQGPHRAPADHPAPNVYPNAAQPPDEPPSMPRRADTPDSGHHQVTPRPYQQDHDAMQAPPTQAPPQQQPQGAAREDRAAPSSRPNPPTQSRATSEGQNHTAAGHDRTPAQGGQAGQSDPEMIPGYFDPKAPPKLLPWLSHEAHLSYDFHTNPVSAPPGFTPVGPDDNRLRRTKTLPYNVTPRRGAKWSREESKFILDRFVEGYDIIDMVAYVGRSPSSITSQLYRLGATTFDPMEGRKNKAGKPSSKSSPNPGPQGP